MKVRGIATALLMILASASSLAHPVGKPNFDFVCQMGSKSVRVATEGDELVYRYGTAANPELTIRGSARNHNLFFLHEGGGRGEAQQLRFVNGDYSYVLYSQFTAPGYDGKGAEDWVKFFVLHGKTVLRAQLCRNAASFEDFDQLDHLPPDKLVPVLD